MRALDRDALEARADAWGRAVSATADIDHFCSSPAWVLPAHDALFPPRDLVCREGDHGWAAFARRPLDEWSAIEPLEAMWCLACPFAATGDVRELAKEAAEDLAREWPADVVFLSGLVPHSPLEGAVVRAFDARYQLLTTAVPATLRYRASLVGGVGAFFERRSASFRAKLRQADRKAAKAGVRFEALVVRTEDEASALHARLLRLEAKSWKGLAGDGLLSPRMGQFYRLMLPRLARQGTLRGQVGMLGGEDVAILVGGVVGTPDGVVFRGLQFSFDDAYSRLALGNVAQLAAITALADEGVVLYDLGSEVDYKRRWGEDCLTTVTLVAIPR